MEKLAYTKNQITWGTFLGGPLAAVYLLKKNFDVMSATEDSQKTMRFGLLFVVVLMALVPILPQFIPSVVYALGYTFAAQSIYVQKQMSLKDNPRFSNWNVLGVALASLAIFIAIGVPLVYFYYAVGIIKD
jgi:hypothetical protein